MFKLINYVCGRTRARHRAYSRPALYSHDAVEGVVGEVALGYHEVLAKFVRLARDRVARHQQGIRNPPVVDVTPVVCARTC